MACRKINKLPGLSHIVSNIKLGNLRPGGLMFLVVKMDRAYQQIFIVNGSTDKGASGNLLTRDQVEYSALKLHRS